MSTKTRINPVSITVAIMLLLVFAVFGYRDWQDYKTNNTRTKAVTQAVEAIPTTCPSTQDEAVDLLTPTAKALGLSAGTLGVYDPPRAGYGVLIEGDHQTILALQVAIYNKGGSCIHRADWGNNTGKTVMIISFDTPAANKADDTTPANPAILPPLPCPKEKGDCEALQTPRLGH